MRGWQWPYLNLFGFLCFIYKPPKVVGVAVRSDRVLHGPGGVAQTSVLQEDCDCMCVGVAV